MKIRITCMILAFTCTVVGFALLTADHCLAASRRDSPFQRDALSQRDSLEDSLLHNVPVWMAENNVPCVGLGLIRQGKVKWIKVFGNLQKGVPAPANALFNIASQTKPVVALLTLQLVQSRDWDLDEPLMDYWIDPDIAGSPYLKKLTTRYVLSHQTGFPNWRSDDSSGKLRFKFEPGTKFGYSGEGYEYLRRALENKFHQPLDKLLDSLLFKRIGMNDTRYWGSDLDTVRFAQWHDAKGARYPEDIKTPVSAADDLITTIGDYCKLGIFVMNGAGLSDTLFADMVRPQVQIKPHYFRGLGWGLVKGLPNEGYALEHGGSDIGVRTMAIFLPGSKDGIVVMTNGDNGVFVYDRIIRQCLPSGADILDIMNKGAQPHERIVLAEAIIERYTGSYAQSNGKLMNVIREGNAIKVSGDGAPTAVLFPESTNKFFFPGYDVQLEFPDDSSLIVYENGKQVMKINKVKQQPAKAGQKDGKPGDKDGKPAKKNGKAGQNDAEIGQRSAAGATEPVSIPDLQKDMKGIAADYTEGRFTGSVGYRRAADYVVSQLKAVGLKPGWKDNRGKKSFFQPVPLIRDSYSATAIFVAKDKTEFYYRHSANNFVVLHPGSRQTTLKKPGVTMKEPAAGLLAPVFIGYGIEEPAEGWDDYAAVDIAGRWVVMLSGTPPVGALQKKYADARRADSLKYHALLEHKAAGVILLPDRYVADHWETTVIRQYRFGYMHYAEDQRGPEPVIPYILIHPLLAQKLFKGESYDPMNGVGNYHAYVFRKTRLGVNLDHQKERINGYNIIAVCSGTDELLKNEHIIVGAHLDHVGKIGTHIYNGANDDASGCVAVLAVAKTMAARPVRRPVLFVFYAGEELNLMGSRHFVDHPPVPLGHILMNINLEQIGSKHRSFDGIWAIGSPEFKNIFYRSGIVFADSALRYSLNDSLPEEIGNTDSYSFIGKRVPSLLLGSGGFPEHHTTEDKIDLIDFEHLKKSTLFLWLLVEGLGDMGAGE